MVRCLRTARSRGTFEYSAERQRQADAGPIPAGSYWIDTSQLVDLRQKWLFQLLYETSWGRIA